MKPMPFAVGVLAMAACLSAQSVAPGLTDEKPLLLASESWDAASVVLGRTFLNAAADFDGDGVPDLAGCQDNSAINRVLVQHGVGDGSFGPYRDSTSPCGYGRVRSLVIGDVDGDGCDDLLVPYRSPACVRLIMGRRDRTIVDETAQRLPMLTGPFTVGIAVDLDRDGDLDLVLGEDAQPPRFLVNDGTGRFQAVLIGPAQAMTPGCIRAADVNGDGHVDLVFGNGSRLGVGELNYIAYNDGTGRFPTAWVLPGGVDSTVLCELHDFDGDGDPDCVFAAESLVQGPVFLRNQNGQLVLDPSVRLLVHGTNPQVMEMIASLDVDQDGDRDIVTWPTYHTFLVLWLNDGTGHFSRAPPEYLRLRRMALGVTSRTLIAADFDTDGDDDLFIGDLLPTIPPTYNVMAFNPTVQLDSDGTTAPGEHHLLRVWGFDGQALLMWGRRTASPLATAYGRFWLDLAGMVVDPVPIPVSDEYGGGRRYPVPNDARLRGVDVWAQALHWSVDPRWRRLTNAHRVRIR